MASETDAERIARLFGAGGMFGPATRQTSGLSVPPGGVGILGGTPYEAEGARIQWPLGGIGRPVEASTAGAPIHSPDEK